MMSGAEIAIGGQGPNHPRNLHSSFSYQLYVLCQYLIVGLWEQSLPVTLLSYLQNITTWDSPMMMMLTHGLWIIICCKHHGEIICFVSKQAARQTLYLLLLHVKALRSVHSGYLGHLRGEEDILHDLRREHVTLCSKVSQETLSHCSLPRLQRFMSVASFCKMSIVSELQFCEVCRICVIVCIMGKNN